MVCIQKAYLDNCSNKQLLFFSFNYDWSTGYTKLESDCNIVKFYCLDANFKYGNEYSSYSQVFAIEKRTNQLNIIAQEIDPSIPLAKIYYFKELNCNEVELTWDYDRVISNLQTISVLIYQELSTDIRGDPN